MGDDHVSEDVLEEYLMGRVSGDAKAALEAHLLECDECARAAFYASTSIDEIKAIITDAFASRHDIN